MQFWLGEVYCNKKKKIILQHGCVVAENYVAIGRFACWDIILQYTKLYYD